MNFDVFAAELRDMLQITEEVGPDTGLEGKDWWDSMSYLYIIPYAEETLGLDVDFEELKSASTLGDIHTTLVKKLNVA